jgi:hypothetical protein
MVLHPDAQRRAQKEIDDVMGTGRLPDFDDEMSLPYVSALVNEVMRWHPVAPVGTRRFPACIFSHGKSGLLIYLFWIDLFSAVPHRLTVDDVYEGYFLPAGSIVIGNTWCEFPFSQCTRISC